MNTMTKRMRSLQRTGRTRFTADEISESLKMDYGPCSVNYARRQLNKLAANGVIARYKVEEGFKYSLFSDSDKRLADLIKFENSKAFRNGESARRYGKGYG